MMKAMGESHFCFATANCEPPALSFTSAVSFSLTHIIAELPQARCTLFPFSAPRRDCSDYQWQRPSISEVLFEEVDIAAETTATSIPVEPMDIMTALKLVLRKSLVYGGPKFS